MGHLISFSNMIQSIHPQLSGSLQTPTFIIISKSVIYNIITLGHNKWATVNPVNTHIQALFASASVIFIWDSIPFPISKWNIGLWMSFRS